MSLQSDDLPLVGSPMDLPEDDPLRGTPYAYIADLGRGGMGEVVVAAHRTLGKRVVVKLMHERLADREDLVDRMRIEAQALARLDHRNLVPVHDFGRTADGRTYLVMERLHGCTLREELRNEGYIPVAQAIDWARQMLAGLAAAHAIGIVHRDVKLENLFLCDPAPDGPPSSRASRPAVVGSARVVKVLDFGIAKVVRAGVDAPAPLLFPTEEGVAIGTPRFFSPEQARGEKVDERTDIYAAGIVLYSLVAGRGPFDHIHAIYELTRAHTEEIPEPPSAFAPQPIPAELDAAILKALAKRPDDRFRSAAEFSEEIGRIAERSSLPAAPTRWLVTEVMERPSLASNRIGLTRAAPGAAATTKASPSPDDVPTRVYTPPDEPARVRPGASARGRHRATPATFVLLAVVSAIVSAGVVVAVLGRVLS